MKVENAIKKLSKAGFTISNTGRTYLAIKDTTNYVIEFIAHGNQSDDNLMIIKVRRYYEQNDIQSDYSAGSFYDTMAQAIKAAG